MWLGKGEGGRRGKVLDSSFWLLETEIDEEFGGALAPVCVLAEGVNDPLFS